MIPRSEMQLTKEVAVMELLRGKSDNRSHHTSTLKGATWILSKATAALFYSHTIPPSHILLQDILTEPTSRSGGTKITLDHLT